MIQRMPAQKTPKTPFGRRLLEARKAKGLTQVDLAQVIGSTQRAISYYEAEGGTPDADVITRLSQALSVSADHLLGLSQEKPETYQPSFDSTSERRLWRRFRQLVNLPEKDRRAVLRMLDSLTKGTTSS